MLNDLKTLRLLLLALSIITVGGLSAQTVKGTVKD